MYALFYLYFTYTYAYLQKRSKEFDNFESSWKLTALCLSENKLREKAGFDYQEVTDILKHRLRQNEQNLKNPTFLRIKSKELAIVDKSWRAFFLGKMNARKNAGFKNSLVVEIKKQEEADIKEFKAKHTTSWWAYFFSSDPKQAQFQRKMNALNQRLKNEERKQDYTSLKKT